MLNVDNAITQLALKLLHQLIVLIGDNKLNKFNRLRKAKSQDKFVYAALNLKNKVLFCCLCVTN